MRRQELDPPSHLAAAESPPRGLGASTLSLAERDFFRRCGYLRIPQAVPTELLEQVRLVAERDLVQAEPPVRLAPCGDVYRVSEVYRRDASYRHLAVTPVVLDALVGVLGPNIELLLNRHNHLTWNVADNKATRLHRDVLQWSRTIVSAVVYLDDATDLNRATMVIPGSMFLPYVGTPNNGGTWMDEHHVFSPLLHQAVPVPMSAGDVLIFDGTLFHAVPAGPEGERRRVVTFAYAAVDELSRRDDHDPDRSLVHGAQLYRGYS